MTITAAGVDASIFRAAVVLHDLHGAALQISARCSGSSTAS
jgi:hypothetical protein